MNPFLQTRDTIIGMIAEIHIPLLIKTTTSLIRRAFNVTR